MNSKNHKLLTTTLPQTLGLSLIGTTVAVGCHHIWRKHSNPHAKMSDYLMGVAEQWQRIEQANQQAWHSWQQAYSQKAHKPPHKKQQQAQTNQKIEKGTANNQLKVNLVQWISGVANKTNAAGDFDDFSVVGIDKNREIVWQTDIPERVHDIVVQPLPLQMASANFSQNERGYAFATRAHHVAVMGRRPSEFFWIMDCATGEILHAIKSENLQHKDNRHFYGHACYSLDGALLYVAENDTVTFGGVIGVYEVANGYQKTNEFSTNGIGPHELSMHPKGDKLIIANGGIKTERASREELNIESMQPSLVYLSLKKGEEGKILQQVEPTHNQMSVRHISAVTQGTLTGTIAIGIQFQGEKHLNVPMVLVHKFGDEVFTEYTTTNSNMNGNVKNKQASWRQFHHYIASVLVNSKSNLICATSPIGGCVSVFDMTTQSMIDTVKVADCAGIAIARHNNQDGFMVSDGQGGLTILTVVDNTLITDTVRLPMAFDNHMQVVSSTQLQSQSQSYPQPYPKAESKADVSHNFDSILERIGKACKKSGRDPKSVRLLPVTKTVDESILRIAYDLGFDRFAENKVQEVSRKYDSMADLAIDWVVIGHLQTNKVKYVARFANEFQALDSVKVAQKLEERLILENRTLDVLIQVNTSGEESKFGLAPADVASFIEQIKHLKHIKVKGLMTLANIALSAEDSTDVRACFVMLRELRDTLKTDLPEHMSLHELSMGMSGDFEIAIEEGATIVRVGQALFGKR